MTWQIASAAKTHQRGGMKNRKLSGVAKKSKAKRQLAWRNNGVSMAQAKKQHVARQKGVIRKKAKRNNGEKHRAYGGKA